MGYRRLTPFFLALLIILLLVGTWYRYLVWQNKESQHLNYGLTVLDTCYRAGINMFSLATAIYFDEIINRTEVYGLVAAGLEGRGRERDLARGSLYRLLYPSFARLHQRNLRHLHFHFPDSSSFLRFHRPEHHGDYLADLQPSTHLANLHLQPIHAFEVGKSASAFRNVYPLQYQGRHLGSVDLSVPFKAMRDELALLMPGHEFAYILDRAEAEPTLADQLPLYSESPLHPRYLIEDSGVVLPGSLPPPSIAAAAINLKLRRDQRFQERLAAAEQSFAVKIRGSGGHPWVVNLLQIRDVEEKAVGYLITYAPDPFLAGLQREFVISLLVAWLLALGLGVLMVLLARSRDEMVHLATTDPLTGLANRRSFMERLQLEQERFIRYGNPVGLLMLDIDFFKKVNDTHGHGVGDEVLRRFAGALKENLRHIDLVGRLGGEEFAVLLPGTDLAGAVHFAERLRCGAGELMESESCRHLFPTSAGALVITASIGVSSFRPDDQGVEPILRRADAALYRAKEQGRNRVEVELDG